MGQFGGEASVRPASARGWQRRGLRGGSFVRKWFAMAAQHARRLDQAVRLGESQHRLDQACHSLPGLGIADT